MVTNNFGTKNSNISGPKINIPVNQTAPFLTYAAGGNGVSRISKQNFFNEQVPIKRTPNTAFISGNIKNYAFNNYSNQELLANGLNSPWSINAQGINKYGNNTAVKRTVGIKSGKTNKNTKSENKLKVKPTPSNNRGKSRVRFTSPLGIEISF